MNYEMDDVLWNDYENLVLPGNTIDLGENAERFNTLYTTIDASNFIYVAVGGKKYLLSDLIKAYDAVHKKKCRIRKGRKR